MDYKTTEIRILRMAIPTHLQVLTSTGSKIPEWTSSPKTVTRTTNNSTTNPHTRAVSVSILTHSITEWYRSNAQDDSGTMGVPHCCSGTLGFTEYRANLYKTTYGTDNTGSTGNLYIAWLCWNVCHSL